MRRAATKVSLTWTQSIILQTLQAHPGTPVSAERLGQTVWQGSVRLPRSWRAMLTNEITGLRRARPDLRHSLLNVRGNGYILARVLRQK